jgi:hypothetical protein
MGSTGAMGMKDSIDRGWTSMRQGLIWHLRGNMFPPVSTAWVEPAIRAIKKANRGEWDKTVRGPEGYLYKGKYRNFPVSEVIEGLRLEFYLDEQEW